MTARHITVGTLNGHHIGKQVTLSNGDETLTDTLVSVTHGKETTRVETETHWDGEWPHSSPCIINPREESRS